jgi:hypothetical protein
MGQSEPTSTHQDTIHWMSVRSQWWMNLNWTELISGFTLVTHFVRSRSYVYIYIGKEVGK